MNFASIIKNDISDSDSGICVSLWFNYCPHRCKGCHNSQLWDAYVFKDNKEVVKELIEDINANGIKRNLSILGGEPLADKNRKDCAFIVKNIREQFPEIKIYLWTGYIYEKLLMENDEYIKSIFDSIDVLIDGPFILGKKSLNAKLRGSSNQRILRKSHGIFREI